MICYNSQDIFVFQGKIEMKKQIEQLKNEKNAVILAHYYATDEVQEIADYVGDSFYLAKIAREMMWHRGA